jgi:CRP-like cAMP-binding protein
MGVKTKKFSEICPKLKPHLLHEGEGKFIVENPQTGGQVVLPIEYFNILEHLNGEKAIKEIIETLYERREPVSFNAVIKTVRLLDTANLFEESLKDLFKFETDKTPHQQEPLFLIRPLMKFSVLGKVNLGFSQEILIPALSVLAILFTGYSLFNFNVGASLKFFPHVTNSPIHGVLVLVLTSSVLISLKTILKSVMLLLGTGKLFGIHLQVTPFSISLGLNENSIYTCSKKSSIVTYGIGNAALYLTSFFIIQSLGLFPNVHNDIFIMSLLLTLIELDPYRASDMTKTFSFLYADDQLKSIKPYLENCTLTTLLDNGESKKDEVRYVVYSMLAFGWSVIFALFSLDLLTENLPDIMEGVLDDNFNFKVNSFVKLVFLGGITAYLAVDLFKTFGKNIFGPLSAIASSKMKSGGKEVKDNSWSRDVIVPILRQNMLFNNLTEGAMEFLTFHMKLKKMPKASNLITQGAKDRCVYFILDGDLEVLRKDDFGKEKHIVDLAPETIVGELAIINDDARSATVKAKTEIVYIEFSEECFKKFMEKPELKSDFESLRNKVEISHFVSSASIFKDFPPEIMNLFVEAGDLVIFPEGSNIVEQGELDKTFYLIIRGSVDVLKDEELIAELGQGDFFGEISLVSNIPRTATVMTKEQTLLLFIESKRFWKILSENIELAMYIESIGQHRMSEAEQYDEAG